MERGAPEARNLCGTVDYMPREISGPKMLKALVQFLQPFYGGLVSRIRR
jgi:hypothetical protein